jgi:hypothetical protein
MDAGTSVRPEPVERLSFLLGPGDKERNGFDKLRPDGSALDREDV